MVSNRMPSRGHIGVYFGRITKVLTRSHGVYLGLITNVLTRPRANHKSPHGLRPYALTRSHRSIFRAYHKSPHQVTSEYISTNVLTRPRRDPGPGVPSSHLTKYFGLYHALTNLYPSRHALTITILHISYNGLSPACCPQPSTGYRPQVAAGLHAISNLP